MTSTMVAALAKSLSIVTFFSLILVGLPPNNLFADLIVLDDDFAVSSLTKDGALSQNSIGWHASSSGSWTQGLGNSWLFNTSNAGGNTSDGAVAQIVDLGALGVTNENQLNVEFTFNSWNGTTPDDIFVHVWGLVDDSASGTASIANLGAQNGNMWVNAVTGGFTIYNLGTGVEMTTHADGSAGNAAIQLLNQDTGTALIGDAVNHRSEFNLTGYTENNLADYDYFVIGFARNPDVGTSNFFALHDVTVTASSVPEPSSIIMLGMALSGLVFRQRRKQANSQRDN
ncbi:MAG: PEP-CTERM sorting domain-containing protein [Planctomicrobium sp.]|nr:PEP-CTERM sorting domain-containing protein [Planctomicrobium sp.]